MLSVCLSELSDVYPLRDKTLATGGDNHHTLLRKPQNKQRRIVRRMCLAAVVTSTTRLYFLLLDGIIVIEGSPSPNSFLLFQSRFFNKNN